VTTATPLGNEAMTSLNTCRSTATSLA